MDIGLYFERIGMSQPEVVSAAALHHLQLAHRTAIPFENIDVLLGRTIATEPERVFEKLVVQRRGGYCFEQNVLLAWVLSELAVPYQPVLARVWLGATDTPPLTHLALLAQVDETDWLIDAGFGGAFVPPIGLVADSTVTSPDGSAFRLTREQSEEWLLVREAESVSQPQYSFGLHPVFPADIALSNHWTATHPSSRFTRELLVNRLLPQGRVALTNTAYVSSADRDSPRELTTADELGEVLRTGFGLALNSAEVSDLAGKIGL